MQHSPIWAVTSYFNPVRYKRRLENFHHFRRNLDIPLIAVELSFDGRFELEDGDADILIRVTDGDILWQKERLLNIGIGKLPPECRTVACLDCDIVFGRPDWIAHAEEALERYAMVQPFGRIHYMGPDWTPDADRSASAELVQRSIAFAVAHKQSGPELMGSVIPRSANTVAPGFAWVFHRELVVRHGLYDGHIVGGGDKAIACAAWGWMDSVVGVHGMNARQERYYRDWAGPFNATVRGQVGCVDGDIFHLWHGRLDDRHDAERHRAFKQFGFDPFQDVAPDAGGCWRWNSDKPHLHAYVRDYFSARREDG